MIPEKLPEFGFAILSPGHNVGAVTSTHNTIRASYPSAPVLCVTGDDVSESAREAMSSTCKTLVGGGTITSLLNTAMADGHPAWTVFLTEGAFVRTGILPRLFRPARDAMDVCFAIVPSYDRQGRWNALHDTFDQATLNGLAIHKAAFDRVGNLSDGPMEISRLLWSLDARNKGVRFKGVLGAKFT